MKIKGFLYPIFLICFASFASCSEDFEQIMDNMNSKTMSEVESDDSIVKWITIEATLPENLSTRATLSASDDLNFKTLWTGNDSISFFAFQNGESMTLAKKHVEGYSRDGKTAIFSVGLPKRLNVLTKDFTLAGLCGFSGKVNGLDSDENHKITADVNMICDSLEGINVPIYFYIKIEADSTGTNNVFTPNFRHLGSYDLLHIINTSDEEITITEGYFEPKNWAYDKVQIDLTQNGISHVEAKVSTTFKDFPETKIPAGESGTVCYWYIPHHDNIGSTNLTLKINDKEYTTVHPKTSDVTIQTGHAYHFYAVFNGKKLTFGKEELEDESLEISDETVYMKPGETKKVYILSGNGEYTTSSGNLSIATAKMYTDYVIITAKNYGQASVVVNDVVTGTSKKIEVNVTTGEQVLEEFLKSMVKVEGGTFIMGNDSEDYINASPAHQVTLSSYYISKFEVTQKLFKTVMGYLPARLTEGDYPIGDNLPVTFMDIMDDIDEFLAALNASLGLSSSDPGAYRLPTEAEWEFAARGGNKSRGYVYSGSNNIDYVAWHSGELNEVGQLRSNELGLYDMSGNAGEVCSDYFSYYSSESVKNPTVGGDNPWYNIWVVRGKNVSSSSNCDVYSRFYKSQGSAYGIGFRIAKGIWNEDD